MYVSWHHPACKCSHCQGIVSCILAVDLAPSVWCINLLTAGDLWRTFSCHIFKNANFTGMIFRWFSDHHNFARNNENQKSFYKDIIWPFKFKLSNIHRICWKNHYFIACQTHNTSTGTPDIIRFLKKKQGMNKHLYV